MKKNKNTLKKENIVYFPGVEKRLLSMGIEQLENKKYNEAADFLLQAREMDAESPEIGTALLLALFEIGKYSEAKQICEDMLHKGIGDYFEIIDVYLIVLIQLREYRKVQETINALIEEKEVPPDKLDHYEKLLQFSKKRTNREKNTLYEPRIDEHLPILKSKKIEDQILDIAGLMNVNIQPYLNDLLHFLKDTEQHPFIQTLILNVLKEHGIERKVDIEKFHFQDSIAPVHLPTLFETPFYTTLLDFLQNSTGQKNPSLFLQIKTILDKHFFLLYPFELEPQEKNLWAAAYQSLGQELYGEMVNMEKMCINYQIKVEELNSSLEFLRKLEEISLPIL